MKKALVFDMDGTIADLYSVPNWLQQIRSNIITPYLQAEPMVNMEELKKVLLEKKENGWNIVIVSWSSKNADKDYSKEIKKAKIEWLKQYGFPADEIHVVKYGTPKHRVIKKDIEQGILIDDDKSVREKWNTKENFYSINPQECKDLLNILKLYF